MPAFSGNFAFSFHKNSQRTDIHEINVYQNICSMEGQVCVENSQTEFKRKLS